ncbi:MAG: hypothetical protein ACTMIK_08050 [Galactobacter sp.]
MSSRHLPTALALGCVVTLSLSLAACSSSDSKPSEKAPAASSSPAPSTAPAEPADATDPASSDTTNDDQGVSDADLSYAVPGYQPGEMPPIPAVELPDLGLLATSQDEFTINATKSIKAVPRGQGLTCTV